MYPPILGLPRHGQRYTLELYAFDYRTGCVLLQQTLSGDIPTVEYESRSLSALKNEYSMTTAQERTALPRCGAFILSEHTCKGIPVHSVRVFKS